MWKDAITLDQTLAYLNELVRIDEHAVSGLLWLKIRCNQALADHPTVQVSDRPDGNAVGLLGLLNGMFGVDERRQGAITAVYESGKLIRFERTNKV